MKVLAVINPISGGVDKKPFFDHFKNELSIFGIEYEKYTTTGKDDDEQLKELIKTYKPDRIASIGGDGTSIFTATTLLNSDIPFGIIPLGSANGMAKELGVDPDPNTALSDFLKSNLYCSLDLIHVNDKHYCMHLGDVGINANIVNDFSKEESRGMTSYAKHFIDRIINREFMEFHIEADGRIYEQTGFMAAIANSRKYGTGVVLNYHGNPTDGRFEVVVLTELDSKTLLSVGLSRFNEELAKVSSVLVYSCKEAKIRLNRSHMLQLDGELIGEVTEFTARIIPSAVKMVTTGKNPFID